MGNIVPMLGEQVARLKEERVGPAAVMKILMNL
jgi:hypothetical protein